QVDSLNHSQVATMTLDTWRPEARAALAQAERLGRITARQLRDAVTEFDSLSRRSTSSKVMMPPLAALASWPKLVDCADMTRFISRPPTGSVTRTSSLSRATARFSPGGPRAGWAG